MPTKQRRRKKKKEEPQLLLEAWKQPTVTMPNPDKLYYTTMPGRAMPSYCVLLCMCQHPCMPSLVLLPQGRRRLRVLGQDPNLDPGVGETGLGPVCRNCFLVDLVFWFCKQNHACQANLAGTERKVWPSQPWPYCLCDAQVDYHLCVV